MKQESRIKKVLKGGIGMHLLALGIILTPYSLLLTPELVQAQDFNLIVCDGVEDKCDYNDLIRLAQNIVEALIVISTFLATAVFAFGGIKLLTSQGNENAMKETKAMLTKVLIGYLWILAAWVLVYTIMRILFKPEYSTLLGAPR